MAGKGGGAWKVAYADFVTAMMAFFLVMWITSQNKAVKESVAQYFENPLGTAEEARATSTHGIPGASADAPLEGQQAGPHGSANREVPSDAHAAGNKSVNNSRPQLHIFERLDRTRSMGTMVVFPADDVQLTAEGRLQLSELAIELRGKPNKVEVRGHANRGPLPKESPYRNAWEVSYVRSVNTMNYLIDCGIEPDRFRLSQDAGYEPYSTDVNEATDPRNARVEVFAVAELSNRFKRSVEERAGDFIPAPDQPATPPKGDAPAKADAHGGGGHGGHGGGDAHGHGAKPKAAAAHGHGGH